MSIENPDYDKPVMPSRPTPVSGNKEIELFLKKIKAGPPESILAGFFREILMDLECGPKKWGRLMNDYLHDKRNKIKQNNRDLSSARGNIQKELFKEGMTWKVFCKGLRFVKILKFQLILRAYHEDGTITEHSKIANFGLELDDKQ